jgi:hypothetical protein
VGDGAVEDLEAAPRAVAGDGLEDQRRARLAEVEPVAVPVEGRQARSE